MKLILTINSVEKKIECHPGERLVSILRRMKLTSVKNGCDEGRCGSCTVLFNGNPVPSCIIPAAAAHEAVIVTLDSFSKTPDYLDIYQGFTQAGVFLCGYCNAAKYFAVFELISKNLRPSRDAALNISSSFTCHCTEIDILTNGILNAANIRRNRIGDTLYVRK